MIKPEFEIFYNSVPGAIGVIVMEYSRSEILRAEAYVKVLASNEISGQCFNCEISPEFLSDRKAIMFNAASGWINGQFWSKMFSLDKSTPSHKVFTTEYNEAVESLKVNNIGKLITVGIDHKDLINLLKKNTRNSDLQNDFVELEYLVKEITINHLNN